MGGKKIQKRLNCAVIAVAWVTLLPEMTACWQILASHWRHCADQIGTSGAWFFRRKAENKNPGSPFMPAVTNQSMLTPSCSRRSDQIRTVVSFPAGQIVACFHGLCRYSVTYTKTSVSEAPDEDLNSARSRDWRPRRDCQTAAESSVNWQSAASSQPVRSSAEQLLRVWPVLSFSLSCTATTFPSSRFAHSNQFARNVSQCVRPMWRWLYG